MRNCLLFISLTLTLLASGCVTMSAGNTVTRQSATPTEQLPVTYAPNGRPEIILTHTDSYTSYFTRSPKMGASIRNWAQYSMMRGYFVTEEPIVEVFNDYYEIMLENGETIYYEVDKDENLEKKFGSWANVMWYDDYKKATGNVGRPIYEGSSITIASYDKKYDCYTTNTGVNVYAKTLKNINTFVSTLSSHKREVFEKLIKYNVEYKEFDDKYFISYDDGFKTCVSVYLGRIKDKVWGRFKVRYHGYDWIFAESYGVLADGYKYNSGKVEFDRHNSDKVWEASDEKLVGNIYTAAQEISKSQKAIVRLYGRSGVKDFVVPRTQKKDLGEILELYSLIKAAV